MQDLSTRNGPSSDLLYFHIIAQTFKFMLLHAHPAGIIYANTFLPNVNIYVFIVYRELICIYIYIYIYTCVCMIIKFMLLHAHSAGIIYASTFLPNVTILCFYSIPRTSNLCFFMLIRPILFMRPPSGQTSEATPGSFYEVYIYIYICMYVCVYIYI